MFLHFKNVRGEFFAESTEVLHVCEFSCVNNVVVAVSSEATILWIYTDSNI